MADIQITSHDDDSVTLAIGGFKAHISAPTWREARDAAHTLGSLLLSRAELRGLESRVSRLRKYLEDAEDKMSTFQTAVKNATEAARYVTAGIDDGKLPKAGVHVLVRAYREALAALDDLERYGDDEELAVARRDADAARKALFAAVGEP